MAGGNRAYFNWSSGKDSALALHYLLAQKNIEIDLLLTTVNAHFNRVSMHGLRRDVLMAQAQALGIDLDILEVPENPSMKEYDKMMTAKIKELRAKNYSHSVFGDIFLEDLRHYREKMLAPYAIKAVFPLWKKETHNLMDIFLRLGYRAVIVCVDCSKLDESFLGRELSKTLIASLPKNVDPCGENGEFHTFCFDGPIFKTPISFDLGERVFRTYKNPLADDRHGNPKIKFGFCDILLAGRGIEKG